jgi:hypothetical protein
MLSTSGAQLRQFDTVGYYKNQDPLKTHFYNKDDPLIQEEVLDSRLGGSWPRALRFFAGFYGIRLAELQIDPQLESTIRPKAWGLHSIWNAILRIAFSIWFLHQDNTSTIEDLQEKNSRTLGNYSRRLQRLLKD